MSVFAGSEDALGRGIDSGGVDAPFAHREWVTIISCAEFSCIGGVTDYGQDLTHIGNPAVDWVRVYLWDIGVQQRNSVDSVAAASVVVVLVEEEIRRWTAVGRHHIRGNDGSGIVPT